MKIILFDGDCNLCNRSVRFIIRHDPAARFHFASLQSGTGQRLLREAGISGTSGTSHASGKPEKPEIRGTSDTSGTGGTSGTPRAQTDTMVYLRHGHAYRRSSAVLRILRDLGGAWRLLYGFIIIPPFIRNSVYRLIARARKRLGGKHNSCPLPSPSHRARFL